MGMPALYVVGNTSGGVSPGLQVSGAVVVMGFQVANNSAAAVSSTSIIDGTSNSGQELFRINLNPTETTREWFGPDGIRCEQGVFVRRLSGDVIFSVFYLPETFYRDVEYVGPTRAG